MSAAFAALGLFTSWYVYSKTSNTGLAAGVFFFFTMELLQAIQYFFIAPSLDSPLCDNVINQVLTVAGYLHICLQPYFTHVLNASLTKNPVYLEKYTIIKRLCLLGGGMLFTRFLLSYQWETTLGDATSTEWLRGNKLCTYKGNYHLAWSVPMADPTYVIPGTAIHSFLMFAPFFALYEKKGMVIQGIFLFAFGPILAGFITPNLMEQASVWCFFSMAQIAIMLFFIRETLVVNWGRGGNKSKSVFSKHTDDHIKEKKEYDPLTKVRSSEKKVM